MKIHEILQEEQSYDITSSQGIDDYMTEGPSIDTTLRAIINDIGEPVLQLYSALKTMARKYHDSNGSLTGFKLVAGGPKRRWYDTFYFNKLGKELRHLTQQAPRHSAELVDYLSDMPTRFGEIEHGLPEILVKIGTKINNKELARNAENWIAARNEYSAFIDALESEGEDQDSQPSPKTPKNPTTGQQSSQVDQIVSSILNSLPKSVAGDIRNAIARSPNKLMALQVELKRRNIIPLSPGK